MNLIYYLTIIFAGSFIKKVVVLCTSFLFLFNCLFSQEEEMNNSVYTNEVNSIRYVSKFPADNKKPKKNLFSRIGEFVFGKNQVVVLSKPVSLFAENPNTFWVLDQGVGSLIKVHEQVGEIPHSFKEKYSSLVGICASSNNEMFFTESRLNKMFKYQPEEDELTEFKLQIELDQPTGIAYSKINDEIWVVETAAHRITVFNCDGEVVRRIGIRGVGPGEFNFPTFIWIDKSGTVYIVDSMNFRIQIFNSAGEFVSSFGEIGDATGYFARPKGIATDSFGNIYIADALFHVVQIFDKDGRFLYHFGKQGKKDGEFWMPAGVFIDDNDYIYVADSYNSRVQVFQLITDK